VKPIGDFGLTIKFLSSSMALESRVFVWQTTKSARMGCVNAVLLETANTVVSIVRMQKKAELWK
jgi:hypothetical protein